MNLGIVGVGKLGLAFALAFEQAGIKIVASSYKPSYVESLQNGSFASTEPKVDQMLAASKNITFTCNNHEVIDSCDIIYVMVATPSLASGDYDVSAVWQVANDFASYPGNVNGKVLVIGCTTNPGVCEQIQFFLQNRGVTVVYCPTFAAQGTVVQNIMHPECVLIGAQDLQSGDQIKQLFLQMVPDSTAISMMGMTAAEIVKLAANCRATMMIAYHNLVGQTMLAAGLEQDLQGALEFLNTSKTNHQWRFGFGFGGPCFPRDNRSFAHYNRSLDLDFELGVVIDRANKQHADFLTQYLIGKNHLELPFYFPYVSYKPGVAIFEESQQLKVCENLLTLGYTVYVNLDRYLPRELQLDLKDRFGDLVRFANQQEVRQANLQLFKVDL